MAYRMSSSSICTHFTQNAWKKDLCSNCFKSKDEHKQQHQASSQSAASKFTASVIATSTKVTSSLLHRMDNDNTKKTDYPNKHKSPSKSIIKKSLTKSSSSSSSLSSSRTGKANKVTFPKNLFEVIGFGGEWSDDSDADNDFDDDDDNDFMNIENDHDDNAATSTDDEETLELKRITKANTDFNMNNGNLLGDPKENIKKSFAALKLGAPQVDKEGKKQTLKINVVPFGASATEFKETTTTTTKAHIKQTATAATATASVKAKFEIQKPDAEVLVGKVEKIATKQNVTLINSVKKTFSTATTTPKTTATTAFSLGSKKSAAATTNFASSKSLSMAQRNKQDAAASLSSSSNSSSSDSDGKNSPPLERAMEKSLLDEISETLEQKKNESKKLISDKQSPATTPTTPTKIKFEITSLSESLESQKPFLDLKKPISRNTPISKDQAKPKINVFNKYSDSDSNCSDAENGISAYYDVVETQISYENLPDGICNPSENITKSTTTISATKKSQTDKNKDVYSSSQYITDMLLSSKTRAASYSLHEGNFMTSKITSDGLVVTKCSSDDALDSTGSSFDGSSDEETSYNMIRSESDSGIGISIGSEYKNINAVEKRVEKKLSVSTNNSDYEDIQVTDQKPVLKKIEAMLTSKQTKTTNTTNTTTTTISKQNFSLEKRRELHGEPDGSADPDGSLENKEPSQQQQQQQLPALPKSPPPNKIIDARPSFLHGIQKQQPMMLKKPDLPVKPVVSPVNSPLKTFIGAGKRQPTNMEQQVISQLQMVMSKSNENLNAESASSSSSSSKGDDAKLKKGRAPNPPPEQNFKSSAPPTPERDYNIVVEFEEQIQKSNREVLDDSQLSMKRTSEIVEAPNNKSQRTETEAEVGTITKVTTTSVGTSLGNNIYARKQTSSATVSSNQSNSNSSNSNNASGKNTSSPVIREKDKRERATVNPKFRSLNTFVTQRNNAAKNLQLQETTPTTTTTTKSSMFHLKKPLTPEPTPRNHKKFSVSEECLAAKLNPGGTSASMANLATSTSDKKSAQSSKQKTKFSIKKFLRMGTSKTTDNLHKKDNVYSEICTGEESGVSGKPRLVIIHPIDINPTAVEVVKDITKTNDAVAAQTIAVVTAKPPAPPLRNIDAQRTLEIGKPARPPPPKSAELRRKQKQISLSAATGSALAAAAAAANSVDSASGSLKSKTDNVYANLGEIRSAIAPRKPERTASMREREAQLELARKRLALSGTERDNQNIDTISICSSNGDIVSPDPCGSALTQKTINNATNTTTSAKTNDGRQTTTQGNRTTSFERKTTTTTTATTATTIVNNETKPNVVSKLEIFENRSSVSSTNSNTASSTSYGAEGRPSSLKDSVRKINNTIDSYLKDKRDYENMYEFVKTAISPPPPPARSIDLTVAGQRLLPPRRNNQLYSDTVSVASFTRSELGPTMRTYGLNSTSLANIPRNISASYCGSEVGEFEIYAPYSYYGSEAGGDVAADINDSVWGIPSAAKNRAKATNRLRMRKGRSVVHKTIEDNYTAVVVANHEALAQVLEQLQQTPIIPPALRPLANAINLRFEDFSIIDGAQAFVVGKKAFHAAVWTTAPVTLALSADCNQLSGVGGELNQLSGGISGVLNPITEFCDLVPSYHLPLMPTTEVTLMQATISVLPRLQLDTLQSIGTILKGKSQVLDKSNFNFRGSIPNLAGLKDINGSNALRNVVSVQNLSTLNEESTEKSIQLINEGESNQTSSNSQSGMPAFDDVMTREVAFIMLQLVNGMKNLQVKAVEEMPLSLSNVVLSKDFDNKDAQARLCVLQGNNNEEEEPMGPLCKCAHIALTEMLPTTKITPILADILVQDRAESLSKAKSVLEFVLWGPSDVVLTGSIKERELALQRWLDLERATVLHGLVRTRVELTVYDECHLMFLVRSTAKIMNDAAKIVFSYQQQNTLTTASSEHQQQK